MMFWGFEAWLTWLGVFLGASRPGSAGACVELEKGDKQP